MKVLITGFDPFNGETINPAFEAVKSMPNQILNYEIIKLEIPTVFGQSLEVLKKAIQLEEPDIVVCTGQAGGRFTITPEYVAINLDEARIFDNSGNKPLGIPIVVDGENAYFTSLPVKSIVRELQDNNIPCSISFTAGTFVCNHVFYGLMHLINNDFPTVKGGFIHVPFLPEQTLDKMNQPYMSLDMMTKGLTLAVKAIIECKEDISIEIGAEC